MTTQQMFDHELQRPCASKIVNIEPIGQLNFGRRGRRPVSLTHAKSNGIDKEAVITERTQHHLKVILAETALLLELKSSVKSGLRKRLPPSPCRSEVYRTPKCLSLIHI